MARIINLVDVLHLAGERCCLVGIPSPIIGTDMKPLTLGHPPGVAEACLTHLFLFEGKHPYPPWVNTNAKGPISRQSHRK